MISIKIKLFLSFFLALKLITATSLEYSLSLSKAQNAYDQGKLDEAHLICKKLIEKKVYRGEAYFLLGRIHFDKGFYRIAGIQFDLAEANEESFILPENKLNLYFAIAANSYYLKNTPKQITYLNRIIIYSKDRLLRSKSFIYKQFLGEANFALGLLYYYKKDFLKAKRHLIIATQNDFNTKTAYLLLAYYYCNFSQEDINKNAKIFYDNQSKTENKESFFTFYFKRYEESIMSQSEIDLLQNSKYRLMISDVEYYYLALSSKAFPSHSK